MCFKEPIKIQDEFSLFSLASEYLDAAEILIRTPPLKTNVSLVAYYLLGHAAELFLKSLLCLDGVSIKELKSTKRYGHNLSKLLEEAQRRGLLFSGMYLSLIHI